MSDSISATPAAAATSTTQQPSQSSDVTTTHDSVDTWLTDERASLREKGNVLLSAIGIDETRLEHALAEETVWMQLRANLISQITDVAFFSMTYWGLELPGFQNVVACARKFSYPVAAGVLLEKCNTPHILFSS
ncbi:hypothetical protein CY34DRAFT_15502 [Suillus luteus UH-Slu-Lm8-n1]|uniref:Uncharacterized protein n=1 Tax=Suillus luteus UH-Slu-Lm8-n1 TaxID=930992 RepID=A0A0D0B133_9AGAM|nr:hypothetical protein CY34DRAFT_15502 [Suillus luteus UH-Slu-Lm8-n1]